MYFVYKDCNVYWEYQIDDVNGNPIRWSGSKDIILTKIVKTEDATSYGNGGIFYKEVILDEDDYYYYYFYGNIINGTDDLIDYSEPTALIDETTVGYFRSPDAHLFPNMLRVKCSDGSNRAYVLEVSSISICFNNYNYLIYSKVD